MKIKYVASQTLAGLHKSDDFVRGIVGPIGSGKSTGCCWEVFRRIREQAPDRSGVRRSRWAIIRNTYRELADTTVKTWLDWFPEDAVGEFSNVDMAHNLSFDMPDGSRVEAEVLFRALDRPKDVKKLLSLELTGAWVNEAKEIALGVWDMLQGRVGRYPAAKDGGCTWFGVLADTNPPDKDHWWYRLFEEERPDGYKIFHQPSGLSKDAENIKNLPPNYYDRITAGKSQEWVRVFVHGEYGFIADGKPIYPEFREQIHIGEGLLANPKLPVYVGIDFGLTPAATFGQRDVLGRWAILHETVTEDMGAVRFAELLKREMHDNFPGCRFEIYGDPAGEQRSQVDERTPFQILQAAGIEARPAPSNDFSLRRESVVGAMGRLIDGVPGLLIDRTCNALIKGMSGGYCYKRVQVAGDERFHDKPDKNRFSHVSESLQYMMLGAGEAESILYADDEDDYEDHYEPVGRSAVGGY